MEKTDQLTQVQDKYQLLKARIFNTRTPSEVIDIKTEIAHLAQEAASYGLSALVDTASLNVALDNKFTETTFTQTRQIQEDLKFKEELQQNNALELKQMQSIRLELKTQWEQDIFPLCKHYIEETEEEIKKLKEINAKLAKGLKLEKEDLDYLGHHTTSEVLEKQRLNLKKIVEYSKQVDKHNEVLTTKTTGLEKDYHKEKDPEKRSIIKEHLDAHKGELKAHTKIKHATDKQIRAIHEVRMKREKEYSGMFANNKEAFEKYKEQLEKYNKATQEDISFISTKSAKDGKIFDQATKIKNSLSNNHYISKLNITNNKIRSKYSVTTNLSRNSAIQSI
jgi:hypothetical protein